MTKRKNHSATTAESRNKEQKLSCGEEDEQMDLKLSLPVEVIVKIISNLTDIEDINNCMLLSKEIHNAMFRTPEVMRNILYSFDCILDSDDYHKFLKSNGKFVKCMKLLFYSDEEKMLKEFLSETPNLEELTLENSAPVIRVYKRPRRGCFCCGPGRLANLMNDNGPADEIPDDDSNFEAEYWQPTEKNCVELPKLVSLHIERRDIKHFLKMTKRVNSLIKLSVTAAGFGEDHIMTNFVSKQDRLKDLSFNVRETRSTLYFPSHDISSDIQFKLKKLQLHSSCNSSSKHFSKFLDAQTGSLIELDLDHSLDDKSLDVIFGKANKLEKLIHKPSDNYKNSAFYEDNHPEWCNENLRYYEDQGSTGVKLDCVAEWFPNLHMLKCKSILKSRINNQLTVLEVDNFDINNLSNVQLTNLKKLITGKVMKSVSHNSWQLSVESIKNLEILEIKSIESVEDIPQIVNALQLLKNLKKFYLRYHPRRYNKEIIDDTEKITTGFMFYKIMIDMDAKTVKVSSYIVRKCKKFLDILIRNFQDFKFYEFCFYVDDILDINVEDHVMMDDEDQSSSVEDGASGSRRLLRKRH